MKTYFIAFFIVLMIAGCRQPRPGAVSSNYIYRGMDFGPYLSVSKREGIRDGCDTALGYYTKRHQRFRFDKEYYNGWFLGRKVCEPLRRAAP
jgi:hypothetical protein